MGTPLETPSTPRAAAIAACGAVSAAGTGLDPLRRALAANVPVIRAQERLAGRGYQSIVAGCFPEEALAPLRDACPRYADARAYLMAWSALDQARRGAAEFMERIPPERWALVLSTTKADIEALENLQAGRPCSEAARRHIQPALLAADLAGALEARGPVQCVSTACASGLLAIELGTGMIGHGAADLVFVAGVDLISHFVLAGFSALKALDPAGCRPFDKTRAGLSLGEGAGALALVRADWMAGGRTVMAGWGSSNDANHLTGPSRDGSGLVLAIRRALERAGLGPESIDLIHLHGTGTLYNDAMESLAVRTVFGDAAPPVCSSKAILGHTLGAAGVLESILCWIALNENLIPGTPGLREPDPVAPRSLQKEPSSARQLRRALKVNCGFGGVNAAVILEKQP